MHSNPDIATLLRAQHGVITRRQARQLGLSRHQVDHRLRIGEWIAVSRGVFRHHLFETTWHSRLSAACLCMDAVASHRSALRLHCVEGQQSPAVEVTVEQGRWRPPPDVLLHQSTQIDRIDREEIDGIPCTGLARSILDFAGVASPARVNFVIDAVLRTKRLTIGDLVDVLVRHSRKGRDGCGRLREALDERTGETAVPLSDFSRIVARLLVAHGLPKPEFEYEIHDRRGLIGRVDLAYPEAKIAIELDSVRWHLNRASFENDPVRRNRVVNQGWAPLSFTWQACYERPFEIVKTVRTALRHNLKVS